MRSKVRCMHVCALNARLYVHIMLVFEYLCVFVCVCVCLCVSVFVCVYLCV